MTKGMCGVPGCDRTARTKNGTICNTHYFRRWRTGEVGGPEIWDRKRKPCVMDGCERLAVGHGYCSLHHQRVLKWGDPTRADPTPAGPRHGGWLGDEAGYTAAHDRVRTANGSARRRSCGRCGARASQWSYDHADPNERRSPQGLPYSLDIARYVPLCVPCHKAFDLAYLAEVSDGRLGTAPEGAASPA